MTVTSGFFDSINNDRTYDAAQMSSLFEGIITDGVFRNIGGHFATTISGRRTVQVSSGKAWVKNIWVNNSSSKGFTIPELQNASYSRIDVIVIDIDKSNAVRKGDIILVQGQESLTNPSQPSLVNTTEHKQVPICYAISTPDNMTINNVVGTEACPYIEFVTDNMIVPISKGGTGGTTKSEAKTNLGIRIGTDDPELIASELDTNDIYIYIQS